MAGGMYGRGGHTWQGACMVGGMCGGCVGVAVCARGMHGRGHACQEGACVAGGVLCRGGMCGRGHAW